jgi:ankyrin repeat protein
MCVFYKQVLKYYRVTASKTVMGKGASLGQLQVGQYVVPFCSEVSAFVKQGDLASVEYQYTYGFGPNLPPDTWFTEEDAPHRRLTMVHVASEEGQLDILKFMLSLVGVRAELPSPDTGNTPLILAVRRNNTATAQVLLENHAVVSCKYNRKMSAICLAVSKGYTQMAAVLLRYGADANDVHGGKALLMLAVDTADGVGINKEMVSLLLECKAYPNVKIAESNTYPIHVAAQHGNCDVLEALLAADAYPCYQDKHGMTPLHYAASKGHTEAVGVLLEFPYHSDHSEAVVVMVKARSAHFKRTPLHECCCVAETVAPAVEIAALLIAHGADVDSCAASDNTALHMAAQRGNRNMVVLLLESGANLFMQNLRGFTPREAAVEALADGYSQHQSSAGIKERHARIRLVIALLQVTEAGVIGMMIQDKEPAPQTAAIVPFASTWFNWGRHHNHHVEQEPDEEADPEMARMLQREQRAKGMKLLRTVVASDLARFVRTSVHNNRVAK